MSTSLTPPELPEYYVRQVSLAAPEILKLVKAIWLEAWHEGATAGLTHSTAPIRIEVHEPLGGK